MAEIEIDGVTSIVTDEELADLREAGSTTFILNAEDGSQTLVNYASPRVVEVPTEE